ncbi:MAG: DUF1150 family protein [Pseudomonadota bacterium]
MKNITHTQHGKPIVYVREAEKSELPDHLQSAPGKFFSVHDPEGKCLAFTEDRKVAFALARQNDLNPVSAH